MANQVLTSTDLSKSLAQSQETILDVLSQVQKKIDHLKEQEKKWDDLQAKIKDNIQKTANVVKLNVGGKVFATTKSTLLRWPNTYFEGLLGSGNWKPDADGCYFIDRNPKHFDRILDYMRSEELDLHGLDSHAQTKLFQVMDYLQIPISDILTSHKNENIIRNPFDQWSSRAMLQGRSLTITSPTNWAGAYSKKYANCDWFYFEIQVNSHKGPGHVRIGIANSQWNSDTYLGSTNKLAMSDSLQK